MCGSHGMEIASWACIAVGLAATAVHWPIAGERVVAERAPAPARAAPPPVVQAREVEVALHSGSDES